ncbi:unnamed protein product [Spirodela intermedia]|uniref:Uncharacterized protein n=1 Tax=Spirodela intermedia TaxID=51605 RepID=A0A7I8I7W8_SPIIN|nr:unnamed protein product [Spirodela intermedia]CAA6653564.1 unnamed protein product [Spirodela intermedia]
MEYTAEIRSYETACRFDQDLQSFDDDLRRRTGGTELLSFYSLEEVVTCLLDTNKEAFTVILKSKKDIWKNPHLLSLVEQYFKNSLQTLDLCAALETCLNKVRRSQVVIQHAIDRFEEEDEEDDDLDEKEEEEEGSKIHTRFGKTLEYLREFRAGGDPFKEFFAVFNKVRDNQLSMLAALDSQMKKLNRKMKSVEAWTKISNVIFASTFAALLICGVVAAAVAAPPVAAAMAAAMSASLGTAGSWVNSLWKKYKETLQQQQDLVKAMNMGTFKAFHELENIRLLVERLEIEIGSVMTAADIAIKDEEAVRIVVDDVKKNLGVFTEGAENLRRHVERCTKDVTRARAVVLQKIIGHPG